MPAVSKAQRRFMGMCEHDPGSAQGKCPPKKVAKEFASTKEKGLPTRVKKKKGK